MPTWTTTPTTRTPGAARALALPWLASALAFVLLSVVLRAAQFAIGTAGWIGTAGLLFTVLQAAVPAAVGVAVARRDLVARGLPAWLLAGMPAPVLLVAINLLRSAGTLRAALGSAAAGTLATIVLLTLLGAFLGAAVTGARRARGAAR